LDVPQDLLPKKMTTVVEAAYVFKADTNNAGNIFKPQGKSLVFEGYLRKVNWLYMS
jgi:hypothetical protein